LETIIQRHKYLIFVLIFFLQSKKEYVSEHGIYEIFDSLKNYLPSDSSDILIVGSGCGSQLREYPKSLEIYLVDDEIGMFFSAFYCYVFDITNVVFNECKLETMLLESKEKDENAILDDGLMKGEFSHVIVNCPIEFQSPEEAFNIFTKTGFFFDNPKFPICLTYFRYAFSKLKKGGSLALNIPKIVFQNHEETSQIIFSELSKFHLTTIKKTRHSVIFFIKKSDLPLPKEISLFDENKLQEKRKNDPNSILKFIQQKSQLGGLNSSNEINDFPQLSESNSSKEQEINDSSQSDHSNPSKKQKINNSSQSDDEFNPSKKQKINDGKSEI